MRRKKKQIEYIAVIVRSVDNPKEQHLIYMETGKFTCNSQFVVNSLQKALDSVIVSFTKVNLIITDVVSYNLVVKKTNNIKIP